MIILNVKCKSIRLKQMANKHYLWYVKKSLKHIALINLSLLYCIAFCLCGSNVYAHNNAFSKPDVSTSKTCYAKFSIDIVCYTAQAENVVNIVSNPHPSSVKNSFKKFSDCAKLTAQLFLTTFYQYSFYSQNEADRLQRTDIIFPFHYFW